MPGQNRIGFEYSLHVDAPPARVLAAFFDARALARWWDVTNVVATPRPLGVYALEWRTSEAADDLLGHYGGVLHGTVVDFAAGRGFLVADCYWLPPESDPVGPMALDISCARLAPAVRGGTPGTSLRVVQRGLDDDSPRWVRYYELLAEGWPPALERMKEYLEKGQGVWDLRAYE